MNQFYIKDSVGLECSIWYWHFVDVVWLFLFVSLYMWGNDASAMVDWIQFEDNQHDRSHEFKGLYSSEICGSGITNMNLKDDGDIEHMKNNEISSILYKKHILMKETLRTIFWFLISEDASARTAELRNSVLSTANDMRITKPFKQLEEIYANAKYLTECEKQYEVNKDFCYPSGKRLIIDPICSASEFVSSFINSQISQGADYVCNHNNIPNNMRMARQTMEIVRSASEYYNINDMTTEKMNKMAVEMAEVFYENPSMDKTAKIEYAQTKIHEAADNYRWQAQQRHDEEFQSIINNVNYNLMLNERSLGNVVTNISINCGLSSDFASPYQLGFQDSASLLMDGIIELHNKIMIYLFFIFLVVIWVLFACLKDGVDNSLKEYSWVLEHVIYPLLQSSKLEYKKIAAIFVNVFNKVKTINFKQILKK